MRRPAVLDPNVIAPTLQTAHDFEGFQGSYASLYATLGLYVLSFPGLWSTIKRATKVALVQNTTSSPARTRSAAETDAGNSGRRHGLHAGQQL